MKIKACFLKSVKLFFYRGIVTAFLPGLFLNTPLFAQLPPAQQVIGKMTVGWNMGNTLEAIGGETAWGGAYTTQKLIDSVKAAGFNSVRLPCSWFSHSDTVTSKIDPDWLARVKQVVDYCINDSMYTIINIHWDKGWLENRVDAADSAQVNKRQHAYWTQIANYFRGYDEHLLFASANEPNVDDATGMAILLSYHQTFINAVRATGGNNASRTLIIQGPSTDIDKTNNLMNTMPTDQISNRLVVEVHYYSPYQFTLMAQDASWGKMFYYWGKGHHSATDVMRNATCCEESYMDKKFELMKTKFVDKGIPVIIGEFGAEKRKLSPPSDEALNHASVDYYDYYLTKSAIAHGMVPFIWDTNMQLFNRSTGAILDHGKLDAIMKGAGVATPISDETSLNIPKGFSLEQNYPNPFNPSTRIRYSLPYQSQVTLRIYNTLGQTVATLVNSRQPSGLHNVEWNGRNEAGNKVGSGVYLYRIRAGDFNRTRKMLLMK